jgi:signal transduction histidine kinase
MRMSNTVHAFLEVSRTDKRSTGLVIQPLDLALIAHRARERHATRAAAKDLSLGVELGKDHVWGTGDASVTEAIMDNLVTNAIKYVPTGGAITILVNDDASGPSIAVRDNGPGVDASQAHLLFTKYASIGSKPTGGEESLGLGLYLAQRMASRMGAKISYEPGEDGGSVFTLRVMQ